MALLFNDTTPAVMMTIAIVLVLSALVNVNVYSTSITTTTTLLVAATAAAVTPTSTVLVAAMATATNDEIPQKFMGRYKLDRSENFDEFLASKGVNWFVRKMIGFTSVTKVLQTASDQPKAYNFWNLSAKKDTRYNGWKLDETFEAEGMDGKMHKITFSYDPQADALKETHIRTDDANDKGETYFYTIVGDELVMKMANDQVSCTRYFKKEPNP